MITYPVLNKSLHAKHKFVEELFTLLPNETKCSFTLFHLRCFLKKKILLFTEIKMLIKFIFCHVSMSYPYCSFKFVCYTPFLYMHNAFMQFKSLTQQTEILYCLL